jgi:hypothetical protein
VLGNILNGLAKVADLLDIELEQNQQQELVMTKTRLISTKDAAPGRASKRPMEELETPRTAGQMKKKVIDGTKDQRGVVGGGNMATDESSSAPTTSYGEDAPQSTAPPSAKRRTRPAASSTGVARRAAPPLPPSGSAPARSAAQPLYPEHASRELPGQKMIEAVHPEGGHIRLRWIPTKGCESGYVVHEWSQRGYGKAEKKTVCWGIQPNEWAAIASATTQSMWNTALGGLVQRATAESRIRCDVMKPADTLSPPRGSPRQRTRGGHEGLQVTS